MGDVEGGQLMITELPPVVLSGWAADFLEGVAIGLAAAAALCAALC